MSRNEDANIHLTWAREAENQKDYLRARIEYMKCVESLRQAGDTIELEKTTKEYEDFVKRDPIFKILISGLLPIIKSNSGIVQSEITKKFTTTGHTAEMVGVFAKGPGEELFRGIHDNYVIGRNLFRLLNPNFQF